MSVRGENLPLRSDSGAYLSDAIYFTHLITKSLDLNKVLKNNLGIEELLVLHGFLVS